MSKLLTKADLAGIAAIAGLSVAGWLLGIRPVVQMKADQLLSAHELSAAERGAERLGAEADALRIRADALGNQFESERVTLEPADAINRRMASLALLAEAHGLTLGQLTPGRSEPAGPSVKIPIKASGAGAYRDIHAFLAALHDSARDVSVSALSLSRAEPGRDQGTRFEMDLYWFAEP